MSDSDERAIATAEGERMPPADVCVDCGDTSETLWHCRMCGAKVCAKCAEKHFVEDER